MAFKLWRGNYTSGTPDASYENGKIWSGSYTSGTPMLRARAGVCKRGGGGNRRGRENRFASRSDRPPVGNKVDFGFPCSATGRSCSAFSTGLQDLQDEQDCFVLPCSARSRHVAGFRARPRQNKPEDVRPVAAGCREANGSASAFRPDSVFLSNTILAGARARTPRGARR